MWRTILGVSLGLAICSGCQNSRPAAPQAQNKPVQAIADEDMFTDPSAETLATREKLTARCPDLSFSGANFADAIDHLRDASRLNIFVNWRALQQHCVKRDLPLTTEITGLTLGEALNKLLSDAGSPNVRLGFTIDEGVVTISTEDDLAKNVLTRVYDIRAALTKENRQDDLAKLIRRLEGIEPLTWRDNGGNIGSVRELSGQLIVTHTPRVQRRIATELAPYQPPGSFPLLSARITRD